MNDSLLEMFTGKKPHRDSFEKKNIQLVAQIIVAKRKRT